MKHFLILLLLLVSPLSAVAQGVALRATNGVGSSPSIFGTARITQIATRPATFTASYNSNNIVGGDDNVMSTNTASGAIAGGFQNVIVDMYPSGSSANYGGALYSFIGGGYQNEVRNANTHIVGGTLNINEGQLSIIGGGSANFIGGAGGDTADGCAILAGNNNRIGGAIHNAFIGAGDDNLIGNVCDWAVIVGGHGNTVSNGPALVAPRASYIGAGRENTINVTNDTASVIAGGMANSITARGPGTIPGGYGNTITDGQQSFALGSSNSITANGAGAIGYFLANATAASVDIGVDNVSKLKLTAGMGLIQSLTVTNLTLARTNVPPTSVTVGTTAPDRWFVVTNGGASYFIPAWINH